MTLLLFGPYFCLLRGGVGFQYLRYGGKREYVRFFRYFSFAEIK